MRRGKNATKGQLMMNQSMNMMTRVSLHADDDSELAGNLNNILGTTKESEDEDSDSGLKGLIQELDKDEEIGEKIGAIALSYPSIVIHDSS